jgi:hypothetical protein
VGFHGDERAAPEIFIMLLQNQHDIFADVSRAHIIEAKLNHTWQRRLGLKKELRKIKVLSQHDGVIFFGPTHDFDVRRIGRSKLAPMAGGVTVLSKIHHPRDRQAVVNDDGHVG